MSVFYLLQNLGKRGHVKVKPWGTLLTLLCCTGLFSQNGKIRFNQIPPPKLSQNAVFCVLQDPQGFMWFGTQDGLNRYDGYQVKVFKNDPEEPNSISDNYIRSLLIDSKGMLWVGTMHGGLNKYDKQHEKFSHYKHDPDDPSSLSSNSIWTLYEDHKGILWIGSHGGGLNSFDPKTNEFTRYPYERTNPADKDFVNVWAIVEDQAGVLWVGSFGGGLKSLDRESKKFTSHQLQEDHAGGKSNSYIRYLLKDESGHILVGTQSGIYRHKSMNKFESLNNNPERKMVVQTIYMEKSGSIWVGTAKGLNRLNPKTMQFSHFEHEENNPYSLSGSNINSLFVDQSGILWIGTRLNGLSTVGFNERAPIQEAGTVVSGSRFAHYNHDPSDPSTLSHNYVNSICEDNVGNIWIGTADGLNRWDRTGSFDRRVGFTRFHSDADVSTSLSSSVVNAVFVDRDNTLWVGTMDGLDRSVQGNLQNGEFTHYQNNKNNSQSLSHNSVTALVEDRAGSLWVGTFGGGLNRLDRGEDYASGRFTRFQHDPANPYGLSHNEILFIHEDREWSLWIGTFGGGLNQYVPEEGRFIHYKQDPSNPESLNHNSVLAIYEDQAAHIWVGTTVGLSRLKERSGPDAPGGRFVSYREETGPGKTVYGILGDDQGFLWLSTSDGLSKFNPRDETFKNYEVRDGLQADEFNSGAYYRSRSGEMFFGGVNGFNVFNPANIRDDPFVPSVVLTEFLIFNKPVPLRRQNPESPLEKTIGETEKIRLSYRDSVLSFRFAALHYAVPQKNLYAYKLEGFNEEWINTDADNRLATFTNLDAGDYVFRVKGSNKDGVWNEEGVALRIRVDPPPWKTWWAYSLYILALAAVVLGYIRFQQKQLAQERAVVNRLRELDRLKDEFLANTSHELRTPLNGIIGLAESLVAGAAGPLGKAVAEDLSLVVTSGKRLAHLVNSLLDFSKLKHHGMELRRRAVDLFNLTEVVLTLSKPLVGNKNLRLYNEIKKNLPPVDVDEDRVQQILYNLVGNAVKFTETGSVRVRAERRKKEVIVSVIDTGIGIRKADLGRIFRSFEQVEGHDSRRYSGTGIGLALSRQLVLLHGGQIQVESTPGVGSTFTFTLPLSTKSKPDPHHYPEPVAKVRLQHAFAMEQNSPILETDPIPEPQKPRLPENAPLGEALNPNAFRILVVDDEPVNCRVLTNYLSLEHYNVFRAESGPEALLLIEDGKPFDLVLLDIMMPRMSGYEVCIKLREFYSVHELPVIFLTAKDQVTDLVEGFAMGANDFLTKPVSKNELLSRVKTHLQLLDINRNLEEKVEARAMEIKEKNEEILMTQQQMAMQEKLASLGTLTAGVAHEINNPTNFAHVSAQNLEVDLNRFKGFLLELAGDEAGRELLVTFEKRFNNLFGHLSTVMEGTNRIKQIVRDLRMFSRLDESERKKIKIGDNLLSTINLVRTKYRETAEFICDLEANPELECWPAQLNQVFMNLIVNACQAIQSKNEQEQKQEPGRLHITTDEQKPWVVIRFCDTGCGIPEAVRDKIFEPFYTTKEVGEGTGLGLSISYGIIKKHEGKIKVDSVVGEGTVFTLYLPLEKDGPQEERNEYFQPEETGRPQFPGRG